MSSYAVFFNKDSTTFRLPVNPEKLEISSAQAIKKYEVLKLGQIAIPAQMELKEYSFECELPMKPNYYVETSGGFKDADFYISMFSVWRDSLDPVRFIASNGIGDDVNTLVLIENLSITEKAGEEGDKYISLSLLEYKPFGKKSMVVLQNQDKALMSTPKATITEEVNPKSNGFHIVKAGESLWSIAKQYYGDGSKCNILYNANKNLIKNPALIQTGWKLKIPSKEEFSLYSAPLPKVVKREYKASSFFTSISNGSGGRGGGGAFYDDEEGNFTGGSSGNGGRGGGGAF